MTVKNLKEYLDKCADDKEVRFVAADIKNRICWMKCQIGITCITDESAPTICLELHDSKPFDDERIQAVDEKLLKSVKNTFEMPMPVKIGGCVWGLENPYEPYFVIGYRIGRMMGEDEEDYEEDYPESGWYIQLSSDYGEMSTPVSDIGCDFFITQDEALQARKDLEDKQHED